MPPPAEGQSPSRERGDDSDDERADAPSATTAGHWQASQSPPSAQEAPSASKLRQCDLAMRTSWRSTAMSAVGLFAFIHLGCIARSLMSTVDFSIWVAASVAEVIGRFQAFSPGQDIHVVSFPLGAAI